ncbi:DUF1453 domain-containing protein [Actinomadura logoneensis]|uniref:DUF1453 domain-containing protein n=1 Tax=Actinomadura logoneensis TaxID=2293572 RepID=A0A372J9M7_9ACTN|nr:DUF1453 domain-containing protein [Actinomadura logoneensis]
MNVLVVLLVLALVLRRQLRAQRIDEARLYTLPVVLVVAGLAQGGLVDHAHVAVSVALLAGEAVTGLLLGAMRAATMRLWREPDGSLWRRGGGLTIAAWVVSIAVRAGTTGLAAVLGVHTGSGNLLAFFGVSLLAQYAVTDVRARPLPAPRSGVSVAA